MNEKAKQILTLVATFFGVFAPFLTSFTPGSSSTGEVSGQYFRDVLIVPADYAFVIWAPIYLGLLAFAVYQALPAQRHNPRIAKTRLWLVASALLNTAWIVVFNNLLFTLSLVIIIGMLVTALVMHRTLEIGETRVYGLERWLRIPFSLYAGWLTVATIVNAAGVLVVRDWGGALPYFYPVWGVATLLVATFIGLYTRFYWCDPVYGGVFAWALLAVALKAGQPLIIVVTSSVLALLFLLSLFPDALNMLKAGGGSRQVKA